MRSQDFRMSALNIPLLFVLVEVAAEMGVAPAPLGAAAADMAAPYLAPEVLQSRCLWSMSTGGLLGARCPCCSRIRACFLAARSSW